jgi:hypothetical protein
MKLAAVDALTDVEHRLTDALADALSEPECARLEFEARLAIALEAEESDGRLGERVAPLPHELADEVAEIARKFAYEAGKVARKSERVPPLRRSLPSIRRRTGRRSWWPWRRAG